MKKTKTIFLVDDDEDDRMLIMEAIRDVIGNVEITQIESGYKLLDVLAGLKPGPDLILMDMNMPKMNGLEILCAMKQHAIHRSHSRGNPFDHIKQPAGKQSVRTGSQCVHDQAGYPG
jgi:CheY-like chemotaxis protein